MFGSKHEKTIIKKTEVEVIGNNYIHMDKYWAKVIKLLLQIRSPIGFSDRVEA